MGRGTFIEILMVLSATTTLTIFSKQKAVINAKALALKLSVMSVWKNIIITMRKNYDNRIEVDGMDRIKRSVAR